MTWTWVAVIAIVVAGLLLFAQMLVDAKKDARRG